MSENYLACVDIGVSFIKTGIYDPEGNIIASAIKANPGNYPKPGVFLQSSEEMVSIVLEVLKEAIEKSGIDAALVEAISFSGAMGGLMGVDKNWEPVAEWSIISDTRYYPYVTRIQKTAGIEIVRRSGTNFPVFAPKILWWKNDFPDIYNRVAKFMGIYGFIIGKLGALTPGDATMDHTISMFSGFADLEERKWSDDLCKEFGIDKNLLPEIVSSSTVVAKLSRAAANQCGFKAGTPLVAGAGDKSAGNLGAGLVQSGQLIDEAATYGAFSLCVDRFVPDVKFRTLDNLPSPIEGLYNPGAYIIVSGATSAWFTEVFGAQEKIIAEQTGSSVFKALDESAKDIPPGSNGLISISLLSGRGYPSDPDIKGLMLGHSLMHKREHFYKSMLESFAYEYAYYLDVMKSNYPDASFEEVLVMGGGSKSDLYNQVKSDVTGMKYSRLSRDDFALLGDMLIAGHAVGVFKDLKEIAKKFVLRTKTYHPDMEKHKKYKPYSKFYSGLFDKVRDIYSELKSIEETGEK